MMDEKCTSSNADKKTTEENQRNQMKNLFSNLTSLLPQQTPREVISAPEQLEEAANYIKKLQAKLEELKQKKKRLMGVSEISTVQGIKLPNMDIFVSGLAVDVVLTTGLQHQFMFTQAVRILREVGAQVFSACYSVADQVVLHAIKFQVRDQCEVARVSDRLRKLVYAVN